MFYQTLLSAENIFVICSNKSQNYSQGLHLDHYIPTKGETDYAFRNNTKSRDRKHSIHPLTVTNILQKFMAYIKRFYSYFTFKDKSFLEPFPIPLGIVGTKYDIYQVRTVSVWYITLICKK